MGPQAGRFGESAEEGSRAAAHHQAWGTTTVVASIASGVPDRLIASVAACASLVADAIVGGIHLEGPFLSIERRGAQNPAALSDVDPALVAATSTPARALSLPAAQLHVGDRADVVAVDEAVTPLAVLRAGAWIH